EALRRLREARDLLARQPDADQASSLWTLADLFLDAGDQDEAEKLIARLDAQGPSPAGDYLRARVRFLEEHYADAVVLFERRRQELSATPALARQADSLAGRCYEQLGNPDQQLAAMKRALARDPSFLPARLGQASALLALGRLDEALEEY